MAKKSERFRMESALPPVGFRQMWVTKCRSTKNVILVHIKQEHIKVKKQTEKSLTLIRACLNTRKRIPT